MEKTCKQCGVTLCDRNWIKPNKIILSKCKACSKQLKSCKYKYNTIQLEKLSSEINRKITAKLDRKKHNKITSLKRKEKRQKKEDYYIEYIPQYKCCTKCNKSKPLNKFTLIKCFKKVKENIYYYEYRTFICIQCVMTASINELKTGYICRMLNLKATETPQELIELKRQQIKLYREYHNKPNKL